MTDAQVIAWIFLSISEVPSTVREIEGVADGINHAIPTQQEMQLALTTLRNLGFVVSDGRHHTRTVAGADFVKQACSGSQTMLGSWQQLTDAISARVAN